MSALRIGVVHSRFNEEICNALLAGARAELKKAGAEAEFVAVAGAIGGALTFARVGSRPTMLTMAAGAAISAGNLCVTSLPPSPRTLVAWMPRSCCQSDVAGTSTPYPRRGLAAARVSLVTAVCWDRTDTG